MKKLLLSTFTAILCLCATAQKKTADVMIIPEPRSLQSVPGSFVLNGNALIHYQGAAAKTTAGLLNTFLENTYGFKLEANDKPLPKQRSQAVIHITEAAGAPEAYTLSVNAGTILLKGDGPGLFYGLQTLQQLLPAGKSEAIHIPGVEIADAPRFAYRGLMLDVGRHFFPPDYIKQFIDVMAQYKFNRFHWHLTEDQGWRIEIKKYPQLAAIASQRKETVVGHAARSNTYDGKPYGGYYTQDEVRDIVKYAAARHITIIPEIEMPGHSQAVLAAFPSFGYGKQYETMTTFGISKEVLNPANDSVFTFLQDVLTEVMDLFPGKYIHIGGDECPKDRWKESPQVQALMQQLGIKDEHALQSYFIQRIEKFVNSKGRSIIGWDEILEGGLAPNATVMSWRGEAGGIAAAKEKHDVIMTPNTYLYLDYYQSTEATEPSRIGNFLPLSTVYNYEPLPASLNAAEQKYIKGVQANIWTEYMPDQSFVDYMSWPRALALSEVAWSPAAKRSYTRFQQKMPIVLATLDKRGVNFRIPAPAQLKDTLLTTPATKVTLSPGVKGAAIYYTIDGSEPGTNSTRYTLPFTVTVPENSTVVLRYIQVTAGGRKSNVYSTVYTRKPYKAAASVKPADAGLRFTAVYKTAPTSAAELPETGDSTGKTAWIDVRPFLPKKNFGITYTGYVKVDADGLYTFNLLSDDGAILYIDDEVVADNDGVHNTTEKVGVIGLQKGFHKIKIRYFNTGEIGWLNVLLSKDGQPLILRNSLFN
jgi:hexosaminidase